MGQKCLLRLSTPLLVLSFFVLVSAYDFNYDNGLDILPTIYGIQGVIYTRSCNGSAPIQGATARVHCKAENEIGYKGAAKFSMITPETDENGYYLATITPEQLGDLKPTDCNLYLESSPSHTFNVATNINQGRTGAPVIYTRLFDKYMNTYTLELYSVLAFVYTSTTKCEHPM